MQGRLFLDIVITQSTFVFKLLSCKNKSLLVRRNALLLLNLGLNAFYRIRRLDMFRQSTVRPLALAQLF